MKIGLNLTGVSYNEGSTNERYRNYLDSLGGFTNNIIRPLIEDGHDLSTYIFTYDSIKKDDILKSYPNIKKSTFVEENYNRFMANINLPPERFSIQQLTYINSLNQLLDKDLDIVISTRFDMCFLKNPFKIYNYDFTKCNFLWREPDYHHLPLVNDTFIVFPHSMVQTMIDCIVEMQIAPPAGVCIGLHNFYIPLVNRVGKEGVQWLDERFVGAFNDSRTPHANELYEVLRSVDYGKKI
jgi:hypothetical protein